MNHNHNMVSYIRLVVFGLFYFFMTAVFAGLSGSLEEKNIIKRITPDAEVIVDQSSLQGAGATPNAQVAVQEMGERIYQQTCKMCHETGLADSPKLGDKKAWAVRISQGIDVLYKHAIEGLKAMPPKGGCTSCSDEEIKKAVEYMVKHSK